MTESQHRILVLLAHPSLYRSKINRAMRDAIRDLPGVTLHELYEAYPEFYIHVRREQSLLLQHDMLVLQYPFYWYSVPPILKLWQDVVLEQGFAYGEGGDALQGRDLMLAISTGGKAESFARDGNNYFTMNELLCPMHTMARRCSMTFRPPLVMHGSFDQTDVTVSMHAQRYRELLLDYTRRGARAFAELKI